jgi:hypothetical protein
LDSEVVKLGDEVSKSFTISDALVVTGMTNKGLDHVLLKLDIPNSFPGDINLSTTTVSVRAEHGTGVEWCRKNLEIEPDIIDISDMGKE